ncbi:hypothetical protein L228DRAFT_237857 [Xylona heveae TC161]|uniref:Uncharacterized protein n=1 Tax=Xylona heveae (strain CBS 132557 / TC161) TaxID=1328760 RepID=A0A161TC17_XYLHT|nr:hypothetical protein L228DRAFT_237857 [Xylona heveae TC161]KZF23277.1 hypothetical protein L228DRAFT_237857 [Xylona heveae TC161]
MATGLAAGTTGLTSGNDEFVASPSSSAEPGAQPMNISGEAARRVTSTESTGSEDPFAAQREPGDTLGDMAGSPPAGGRKSQDRRMSKEWDASKVPPSRFQKREGSIFATQGSRDAHVGRQDRDKSFFDKLKEKVLHSGR